METVIVSNALIQTKGKAICDTIKLLFLKPTVIKKSASTAKTNAAAKKCTPSGRAKARPVINSPVVAKCRKATAQQQQRRKLPPSHHLKSNLSRRPGLLAKILAPGFDRVKKELDSDVTPEPKVY